VLERVVAKTKALAPGTGPGQVGAVIDAASKAKIMGYINGAVNDDGAKVLVDGRSWADASTAPPGSAIAAGGADAKGNWVGPTVLLHASHADRAVKEEIFGPVLSVVRVGSWQEALEIENASPFGNAAW
jgi:malonate-semialdehyde dehydrogenase (acetylating)/methylmalonate-semialdehyde dehydrogenase